MGGAGRKPHISYSLGCSERVIGKELSERCAVSSAHRGPKGEALVSLLGNS